MKQKHRISLKRIRKCDYTDAEITAIIDGFVENNEILSSTLKNDVTKKNKDDSLKMILQTVNAVGGHNRSVIT